MKTFFHIDLDAFFASVEQLDHPSWRGKPVIVGGLPEDPRSVVSTASYEARKYGVHSAMSSREAYRLCPQGIFTHGNMKRYMEISETVMNILRQYSPEVFQISIDEASIEMTGTERLFGPIKDCAYRIQNEIFLKTGLTVSIGIASTRYIAKIASDMRKPNGIYQIPHGLEEDFMLSLPLEKVWGVGKMGLKDLHSKGIHSTKDIHRLSLDNLKLMFGNHRGLFLYNTVRGIETPHQEKKTHSLSNETTFPQDIRDIYALKTTLLSLAYQIIFRLHREEGASKTIMLKIRYEDFTTNTFQETSKEYITSADDLFERASSLLDRKLNPHRGVRLLGLCVENIHKKNQEDLLLFDFGEKKKGDMEKAILKIQDKYPQSPLIKARMMLNKVKLLFLALLIGFATYRTEAETKVHEVEIDGAAALQSAKENIYSLPKESPKSLFQYQKDNKEVEFDVSGSWQGEFTGSSLISLKGDNSASSPIFKQEVDLSMLFMLNKRWYFETEFQDEFSRNTVAMGYKGSKDNLIEEVRISNRGLKFPTIYSTEYFNKGIGGGDNQAPGFMVSLKDPLHNRWRSDLSLRYSMTETHDATFYGKNQVNDNIISLSSYVRGLYFVLPSSLLENLKNVYVESTSGDYRDSKGRKYKKLSSDLYLVSRYKNLLVLSKDAGSLKTSSSTPYVVLEFYDSFDSEIGSFSDSTTFLGKVKSIFSYDLSNYRPRPESSTGYNITLDGKDMLLVSGNFFSPFEVASRYDLGSVSRVECIVGSAYTKEGSEAYSTTIIEGQEAFVSSDFFCDNHLYVDVYTNVESTSSYLDPKVRFPFASTNPECYLNLEERSDLSIISRTYTPVPSYDIGCNINGASVRVYKNSILDNTALYDADNGTVTILGGVSDMDKIYITWSEDSSDNQNGNLEGQASFLYNITDNLKADLSLSSIYCVSPYISYAEYGKTATGFISLTGGMEYQNRGLTLLNATSLSVINNNVTGKYRILGFEDNSTSTTYLSKSSAYSLEVTPSLNDDSYYSTMASIEGSNKITGSTTGVRDASITGYKIPLGFSFDSSAQWAAINIKLSDGSKLLNGDEFHFTLKSEDTSFTSYKVYLQLGVEASSNPGTEEVNQIPTYLLTGNTDSRLIDGSRNGTTYTSFDPSNDAWQNIGIRLTEEDKSRLINTDLRLIVVSGGSGQGEISIGPYEISTKGITTYGTSNFDLSSEEIKDNSVPHNYNTSDNYIEEIIWNASGTPSSEDYIIASKCFNEVDISGYKKLEFYFKLISDNGTTPDADNEADMVFILDRNGGSIKDDGEIALKATLHKDAFSSLYATSSRWHTLTLDLEEELLLLDGTKLPSSDYSLKLHNKTLPNRMRVRLNPLYTKGRLLIDELFLKDTSAYYSVEDTLQLKYEAQEITINNLEIFKNFKFDSRSDTSNLFESQNGKLYSQNISTQESLKTDIGNFNCNVSTAFSSDEKGGFVSGSHAVKTNTPLLKVLNLKDSFVYNHSSSSRDKSMSIGTDFYNIHFPLSMDFTSTSSKSSWTKEQSMEGHIKTGFKVRSPSSSPTGNSTRSGQDFSTTLNLEAKVNQKLTNNSKDDNKDSYFTTYKDMSLYSFDLGESKATNRSVGGKGVLSFTFPIPVNPSLTYGLEGKYTKSSEISFKDKEEESLHIPFKVGNHNFSMEYSRTGGGRSIVKEGGDYREDLMNLGSALSERSFMYTTIPFYEFFNNLKEDIRSNDTTESTNYTTGFSTSWRRGLYRDLRDLFIPSQALAGIQRDIIWEDNSTDTYQIKSRLALTPFNLFGTSGKYPLFSWYKTDEYNISFQALVRFPRDNPEELKYLYTAYAQGGFFTDSSSLKCASEVSFENDAWSFKESMNFTRKVRTSPVVDFVGLFLDSNTRQKCKAIRLKRTDGLDGSISYNETKEVYTRSLSYTHKIEGDITKYVSSYISTSISYKDLSDYAYINLEGSLGAKIRF